MSLNDQSFRTPNIVIGLPCPPDNQQAECDKPLMENAEPKSR